MKVLAKKINRAAKSKKSSAFADKILAEEARDIKLCKDYIRRKESGTLKLVSWEEAKRQLEF